MKPLTDTDEEFEVGPEPLAPRITGVEPRQPASVLVSFESGERRTFDVAPLLGRGIFQRLADPDAFSAVSVVEGGGGIEWAAGPDLSANNLYFCGRSVS